MSVFEPKLTDEARRDVMRTFSRDAEDMLSKATAHVKQGRYLSLFQTNLETAMMYLNKAIAHDGLKAGDSDGA